MNKTLSIIIRHPSLSQNVGNVSIQIIRKCLKSADNLHNLYRHTRCGDRSSAGALANMK